MMIKRFAVATFSAALVAGLATWSLEPGQAQDNAVVPVARGDGIDMIFGPPSSYAKAIMLAQAAQAQPVTSEPAQNQEIVAPDATGVAPDASPLDRVSIVKQSIRRAGLGSRAMAALVLRNGNDYAVKDIEVRCAFKSRDGSFATERVRKLDRTLKPKSREALKPTLVGFINVMASDGKCSLVSASRV